LPLAPAWYRANVPDDAPPPTDTRAFAFRGADALIRDAAAEPPLPTIGDLGALAQDASAADRIGEIDGTPCVAVALAPDAPIPAGFSLVSLRLAFPRLGERTWKLAGRAYQLLEFERTHRFCGACATPTEAVAGERARRCPACDLTAYPRVSPAIIVLVERGDDALLAQPKRMPVFYSTLAGFVEPGESLEETILREVREETGVEITDPRYFGSQPWPFPHSLMVGFHATYAGGALRPDSRELGDTRWFRYDALPAIPPRFSIARALIDAFVERRKAAL
jgi:NAD+ diphosphatase